MTTTSKSKDAAATDAAKKKPLAIFSHEGVNASVFANVHKVKGEPITFHQVSFSKEYRKGTERRWTTSFDFRDLNALQTVMRQAGDYLLKLQYADAAPSPQSATQRSPAER